jgi:hypothetical protein
MDLNDTEASASTPPACEKRNAGASEAWLKPGRNRATQKPEQVNTIILIYLNHFGMPAFS